MDDLEFLRGQMNALGTKREPKVYQQNWKPSKAGNLYCLINKKLCVIGQCKTGAWWGRTPEGFVTGYFGTKQEAIDAVNRKLELY
jgi:hypothetical protein